MEDKTHQLKEAIKTFNRTVKTTHKNEFKKISQSASQKIIELSTKVPQALRQIWEDLQTLVKLLADYLNGSYRQLPWNSVVAIAAALSYFVLPLDAIADFIPLIGYFDDLSLLSVVLTMVHQDLEQYKQYKKNTVDVKSR